MIARHVETLFCDDIRHELGGKISYIGVYSGSLFVRAFPATLPRLCLSVRVVTPALAPLRALTLRVLKDNEPLQELTLDDDELAAASDAEDRIEADPPGERLLTAQFMLVFSPIRLDGPGVLRVRVRTETEELDGMALRVGQLPADLGPI